MTQTKLIVILSAILLAVLLASGVLIFVLPSSKTPTSDVTTTGQTSTTTTPTDGASFNSGVLQKSGYVTLDKQMIQDGRLPVQPPAGTGKANPFL